MAVQAIYSSSEYDSTNDQQVSDVIYAPDTTQDLSEDYCVENAQIKDRNGNYIFTVGNVGCGKSTIQSMLVSRLWHREDISFGYHNCEGDHRHDKVLNDMVTSMHRGILPDRTKQGRLQEFAISMAQKGKKPLELNFLEISGEDIRSIVPTFSAIDRPMLNSQLVEYLKVPTSQINKRFIFVSDAEEHRKGKISNSDVPEDILFNELLRYLLGKDTLAMQKINVFFVVAKWDLVKNEYSSLDEYISRNFPQTRGILNSDRCTVRFVPFSVGEFEDEWDENEQIFQQRIKSLNSHYIDYLLHAIYHSFTRNELNNFPRINRTLRDRIMGIFL